MLAMPPNEFVENKIGSKETTDANEQPCKRPCKHMKIEKPGVGRPLLGTEKKNVWYKTCAVYRGRPVTHLPNGWTSSLFKQSKARRAMEAVILKIFLQIL